MTETLRNPAEGSLLWSVRESLLRYVTVVAAGTYEMSDGVTVDDSGVFTFPLRSVISHGADRRLSFSGWVHFAAHHGLLDIRIVDPEVILGPNGGVIVARTSRDDETIIPIVAVDAATAIDHGGELSWGPVATRLIDDAVSLFGNVYPTGTEMAPFTMRVALDS